MSASHPYHTTLIGHWKLNPITGATPSENDPKYEEWDDEDSLIMKWIWNSVTPEISKKYMFFPTARDLWDNVHQTYSMKQDTTCYELKTKIFSTNQGPY